jgi:hypothetical protein
VLLLNLYNLLFSIKIKKLIEIIRKNKVFIFFLILVAVQVYWIVNSSGFYFIDDSCHFNYNRHLLSSYNESIGSWHRLGRVWLFALPAQFGLKGTQIFSAIIFLFTIFIAYKILKIKNVKYPEWVVLVIGFQPVLFNISYTVLAELPAACLIILSLYFYFKDKYIHVMIFSSLIFIFRTEYYFIAGIFLIIYLFKKKWIALPLFAIGPFLWFLVSWIITGEYWRFSYDMMLHSRLPRITEGIDWYYYLIYSPVIFGLLQVLFFIIGTSIALIGRRINDFGLMFLIILCGLLVQTLAALKGLNSTCSTGQLRYLAVVGPVFGIITTFGLSSLWKIIKNPFLRGFIQILFAGIMFFFGPYSTPFHSKFQIEKVSDEIVRLTEKDYPEYKVISNLHYIANAMDEAASGGEKFKTLTRSNLNKYDKAIIAWDNNLETSPFVDENVSLKNIEKIPGIKILFIKIDTVDHDYDVPIYKFYKYESEFRRKGYEYLTHDQYCWENYEIKVFVKN